MGKFGSNPRLRNQKDPFLRYLRNQLNERRRTVVVVSLSTAPSAAPPLLVPVDCAGKSVIAVVDQIRAVAKERLQRRLGKLSPRDLIKVEDALRTILEL